jgi:hypothetical protein
MQIYYIRLLRLFIYLKKINVLKIIFYILKLQIVVNLKVYTKSCKSIYSTYDYLVFIH